MPPTRHTHFTTIETWANKQRLTGTVLHVKLGLSYSEIKFLQLIIPRILLQRTPYFILGYSYVSLNIGFTNTVLYLLSKNLISTLHSNYLVILYFVS